MTLLIAGAEPASQIYNPAISNKTISEISTPQEAGNVLATYIGVMWQTLLILGGLALLVNLLMGGLGWVTAGGEKGKIESSKERITQSIIGYGVLAAVAAISIFLSNVFGLNLLKPMFPNLL